MSQILTPRTDDWDVLFPFGPPIGYKKLKPDTVDYLNAHLDESTVDWSDNLVGKVTSETRLTPAMELVVMEDIQELAFQFCNRAQIHSSAFTSQLDTSKYNFSLKTESGWFVRQHEGEYNPIHLHTGCTLSCVGYLSLPEGIEAEWEEDYKDHHPANGHIQFIHGTPSKWSGTNFLVKPVVGDLWLFPSDVFHCVYPFKTVGERRSFSMNMEFTQSEKEVTNV